MHQAGSQNINDFYMYKFRTNLCSMKGKCQHQATCFYAHSKVMKRRVPKYERSNGLFNYIPEPCRQWRRWKTCSLGEACPRSHGCLEIIYHPLLYKTKLCKSNRQNGTCTEYGVYCAKAHTRSEIRSLVDIFGENWKRHYDLSNRFCGQRKDVLVQSTAKKKTYRKRVGLAVPSKAHQMPDIHLFANYLLEKRTSERNEGSQLEVELWSDSDDNFEDVVGFKSKNCFADDGNILSYSPLHTSKPREKSETSRYARLTKWEQESLSPSTDSSINAYKDVQHDWEHLSWLDTDLLMLCGKDSSQSDEQLGTSDLHSDESDSEFNYDRVPQNWFLSSCQEKASEVFMN